MNDIQIFNNSEFGAVRTVEVCGTLGGDVMGWTWIRERYKNDPEYLAIMAEERRTKDRERYARKKEKKNNDDTRRNTDNHTPCN